MRFFCELKNKIHASKFHLFLKSFKRLKQSLYEIHKDWCLTIADLVIFKISLQQNKLNICVTKMFPIKIKEMRKIHNGKIKSHEKNQEQFLKFHNATNIIFKFNNFTFISFFSVAFLWFSSFHMRVCYPFVSLIPPLQFERAYFKYITFNIAHMSVT